MTERDPWSAASRVRESGRWVAASSEWNTGMSEALLSSAEIKTDSVVLDVASGSGDPALAIAKRIRIGTVIALDSSIEGLLLANTASRQFGLGSRFACLRGDAHALPLAGGSIDRITCRCGIMYFRDTVLALSEMLRVL